MNIKYRQGITSELLKAIIVIVLLGLLFAKPLYQLIQIWMDDADYSHGLFVIPISIYMIWKKRQLLENADIEKSRLGLVLFIMSVFLYAVGIITNFHTLSYISMILTLVGVSIFAFGWKTTKIIIWPILFLAFMFPIPSSIYILITNPLKLLVTDISSSLIHIFGIPVLQEGNLLYFSNTQLEVAEACSGLRSIYSYLMLSCVFTLICKKKITKTVLIMLTIPLAMFVNIVRVTGTGVLSYYFGPSVAQGFFHEFAGLLLFMVGLVLLYSAYFVLEGKSNFAQKEN